MSGKRSRRVVLAASLAIAMTEQLRAGMSVWQDQTYSGTYGGEITVGFSDFDLNHTNPFSPTFEIISPAVADYVWAFNDSVVNMRGGRIVYGLSGTDKATINLFDGLAGGLSVSKQAKANMSGGIANVGVARDNGQLSMTGGNVMVSVSLFDSATADVKDVTIGSPVDGPFVEGHFEIHDQGHANVENTKIAFDFQLSEFASAELTNTTIGRNLKASGTGGSVQMTGGTVVNDINTAGPDVTLDGTTIGGHVLVQRGNLTMSNNLVVGSINAANSPTATLSNVVGNDDVGGSGATVMTVTNGQADRLSYFGIGSMTVSGTKVVKDVNLVSSNQVATFNLDGVTVGGDFNTGGSSRVAASNITVAGNADFNGTFVGALSRSDIKGDVLLEAGAHLDVTDSTLGEVTSLVSGFLRINGGSITRSFNQIFGTSEITGTKIGEKLQVGGGSVKVTNANIGTDLLTDNGGFVDASGAQVSGNVGVSNNSYAVLKGTAVAGQVTVTDFAELETTNVQMRAFFGLGAPEVSLTDSAVYQDFTTLGGKYTLGNTTIYGPAVLSAQTFAMTGGTLAKAVTVTGSTSVTLDGTSIGGGLLVGDTSVVELKNVTVPSGIGTEGTSILNLISGNIGTGFAANGQSVVTLAGGVIDGDLTTNESSVVSINGATITGKAVATAGAIVMHTGRVQGNAGVTSTGSGASFDMRGGTIDGILLAGAGKVTMSGGRVAGSNAGANGDGAFEMSGGVVDNVVAAFGNSTVLLSGTAGAGEIVATENATLILDGASIGSTGGSAGTTAHAVIKSGRLGGDFKTSGNAILDMHGGLVFGSVAAGEHSGVNMFGGSIAGDLVGAGNALVSITGGSVSGNLVTTGDAIANFSAGSVSGSASAQASSHLGINGTATVAGNLDAQSLATVVVDGGTVQGALSGFGNATINMSAGTISGGAFLHDHAVLNFTGGKILGPIVKVAAVPAFDGPSLLAAALPTDVPTPAVVTYDDAVVNFIGYDLVATLIDSNYQGSFSLYQVTGRFGDGSLAAEQYFTLQNGGGASYNLIPVPEPAALLVLAAPVILLARRRKTIN